MSVTDPTAPVAVPAQPAKPRNDQVSKIEHYILLVLTFGADAVLAVAAVVGDISGANATKWGTWVTIAGVVGHTVKEGIGVLAGSFGQTAPDDTAFNDGLQSLADQLGHQAESVHQLTEHLKTQPAPAAIDEATQQAIQTLAKVHDDVTGLVGVVSDAKELADPPPASDAPGEVGAGAPAPDPAIAGAGQAPPTAAAPGPVVASTGPSAPAAQG